MERLTNMIRGIGDPISAAYARMYLVKSALLGKNFKIVLNYYRYSDSIFVLFSAIPNDFALVRFTARLNYLELIALIRRCTKPNYTISLNHQLTVLEYLEILSVPLEWLIRAQMIGLPNICKERDDIVKKCINEVDDLTYPEHILSHLLYSCSSTLLSNELIRLTHVISQCNSGKYPFHQLLMSFLSAINRSGEEIENKFSKKYRNTLQKVLNQCWTLNVNHFNETNYIDFLRQVYVNHGIKTEIAI